MIDWRRRARVWKAAATRGRSAYDDQVEHNRTAGGGGIRSEGVSDAHTI